MKATPVNIAILISAGLFGCFVAWTNGVGPSDGTNGNYVPRANTITATAAMDLHTFEFIVCLTNHNPGGLRVGVAACRWSDGERTLAELDMESYLLVIPTGRCGEISGRFAPPNWPAKPIAIVVTYWTEAGGRDSTISCRPTLL